MKILKDNLCPVCGFDFLKEFGFKPWEKDQPSDEICPSCSFRFGLDDYDNINGYDNKKEKYIKWRKKWINDGMIWDKGSSILPKEWDPTKQLEQLEN